MGSGSLMVLMAALGMLLTHYASKWEKASGKLTAAILTLFGKSLVFGGLFAMAIMAILCDFAITELVKCQIDLSQNVIAPPLIP
jgi:hypothetical protein